jgi:hypothetical protein
MNSTPLKPSSLKIAMWNANGLLHKRQELQEFAFAHNLDAILISETHLNAGHIPNLPSYVFHRNDRQTGRGGGTGVYIKRCIDHYALITPAMRNEIEATCVVVRTASSGSLKIVSAYNPPGCHLCDADLDTLLSNTGPTILCGDLNAKHAAWNSRRANAMGTELHGFSLRRNDVCILGPTEPTLYHHRGSLPDVIDIVIDIERAELRPQPGPNPDRRPDSSNDHHQEDYVLANLRRCHPGRTP